MLYIVFFQLESIEFIVEINVLLVNMKSSLYQGKIKFKKIKVIDKNSK